MKRFNWLLIVLALSNMALNAVAATFTLTPTVSGRFDDAFSPLPFGPLAAGSILDGAGYYQIDFDFTISDLAPEDHGFMGTAFDLQLTGGLADLVGSGWSPFVDEVDADGSIIGNGPRYAVNVDAGLNGLDFQRIVAAISPQWDSSDSRTTLGIDSPARLGSVYLHWDGITYSSLSTREVSFAMSDVTGGYAMVPGNSAGAVIEFGTPGPDDVRPVPQPAFVPPPPPPITEPPVAPPVVPPLPNPDPPQGSQPDPPVLPNPVDPPVAPPVLPPPPSDPGPPPVAPPPPGPSPAPAARTSNATFTLTPKVVARLDDNFAALPLDTSAEGPILSGPGFYQIDLSFNVGDLAPEEHGFVATSFDLKLTGGLTDQASAGWNPYVTSTDGESGSLAGGISPFFINMDAGQDSLDLQRIVATIDLNLDPSDPRTTMGNEDAAPLGSVYLYWDGSTYSSLSTSDITFALSDTIGEYFVVPGTAAGAVIEFGIPEPGIERVQPEPATRPTVEPPVLEVPPLEGPPPLPTDVDLSPTVLPPTVEDPIDPPPAIPDPQPPVPGPDGDDPPPINPPPNDPAEWVFVRPFPFPEYGYAVDPVMVAPGEWLIRNGEYELTKLVPFPGTFVTTIDDTGIVFVGDTPTDAELFAFGLPVLRSQPHTLQLFVQAHTNFFLGLNGQGAQFGSQIGAPEPSSALLAILALLSLPAFARRRGSLVVRPIADSR